MKDYNKTLKEILEFLREKLPIGAEEGELQKKFGKREEDLTLLNHILGIYGQSGKKYFEDKNSRKVLTPEGLDYLERIDLKNIQKEQTEINDKIRKAQLLMFLLKV